MSLTELDIRLRKSNYCFSYPERKIVTWSVGKFNVEPRYFGTREIFVKYGRYSRRVYLGRWIRTIIITGKNKIR